MKEIERRKVNDDIEEIFSINEDDGFERKCYKIDKKKKKIICYIEDDDYFVDIIHLEGFTTIPKEFSDKGYIPSGVQYALNVAFRDFKINKFTISKEDKKDFRKVKDGYNVTIPYTSFAKYKEEMIQIDTERKVNKRKATNYFLSQLFPKYFEIEEDSINRKKNQFISGLDIDIIPKLSKNELLQLQDFVFCILDNKYIDVSKKIGLISQYKKNVDTLVVDEAIKRFEENINKSASERKATILSEDIKRESNEDIIVVKPKAHLIIGSSEQLINDNMRDDFRILRDSLKNIEIILYDELFERFKNLKNRTFK